jgi:hypothetical protein
MKLFSRMSFIYIIMILNIIFLIFNILILTTKSININKKDLKNKDDETFIKKDLHNENKKNILNNGSGSGSSNGNYNETFGNKYPVCTSIIKDVEFKNFNKNEYKIMKLKKMKDSFQLCDENKQCLYKNVCWNGKFKYFLI